MANQTIQNYFNDKSIPKATRAQVLADLNAGKVDEMNLEKVINTKHGDKYSKAPGDYFGKGVVDSALGASQMGANATATVGEGIGNTAGFLGQAGSYVDPVMGLKRVAQAFNGGDAGFLNQYQSPGEIIGGQIQGGMKSLADITRQSAANTTGKGQSPVWGMAGDVIGTGANIVGGAALGAGYGEKAASSWPSVFSKLKPAAQFIGQSLIDTQGINATTEGKLASKDQLGAGLAIDSVLGVGGKIMKGLSKKGLASIPQFTPTVKAELGQKGLDKVGEVIYKNIDNIPVTTSRETIGKVLSPLKQKTYSVVNDFISRSQKLGAGTTTIDDMMDGVKKAVVSETGAAKAGLSLDEVPKAVEEIDKIKQFYSDLYGNQPLNLSQVQQLKKGLRYKAGSGVDSLISAKNQFKEGVRKNAQTFVEDQVGETLGKEAKTALINANADYNVIKKLTQTLKKKAPYSGYLTDVVSGASGAASSLAQGNLGDAIKNAATAIGLKRLATSAAPKIIFAKAVTKTPNNFLKALSKALTNQITKPSSSKGSSSK